MTSWKNQNDRLEEILQLSAASCFANVHSRFLDAAGNGSLRMVFLGTGFTGRTLARSFSELGMQPLAFIDNNPALQGTRVEGCPVLSAAKAVASFGEQALFIPTVHTNGLALAQLQGLGVRAIPLAELLWQYTGHLSYYPTLSSPEATAGHESRIRQAMGLWSDQVSREEFIGQLRWRRTLDRSSLPSHLPARDIYFPKDLMDLSREEFFVDCGAFDGDSLRAFLARVPDGFRAFWGIEADSRNFSKLEAFINALPASTSSRCKALRFVVGNRAGETVGFTETGTWGSTVLASADKKVPAVRLDDLLRDVTPTFIKMDVEGSEPDVLDGARKIIQRHRPVLAICLYHRHEDLWELPLKIRDIYPDYRFFLRRYSDECWEQVCYAIPAERCKMVK